jgi:hypothetical protein
MCIIWLSAYRAFFEIDHINAARVRYEFALKGGWNASDYHEKLASTADMYNSTIFIHCSKCLSSVF